MRSGPNFMSWSRFIASRSVSTADPHSVYKKDILDNKMRNNYLRVTHDGRMFVYGNATQSRCLPYSDQHDVADVCYAYMLIGCSTNALPRCSLIRNNPQREK